MNDGENSNNNKSLQGMAGTDMMAELMGLISQEGISDNKVHKILDQVERFVSEPDKDHLVLPSNM